MNTKTTAILTFLVVALTNSIDAKAGDNVVCKKAEDVNTFALVQQLQKGNFQTQRQTLVMWLPVEYFEVVSAQDEFIPATDRREMLGLLDKYMFAAVLDSETSLFGNSKYTSDSKIFSNTRVTGANGKTVRPIDRDRLPNDVKMLISCFEYALGEMGEGVTILTFPAYDASRKRIADPTKNGRVTVTYDDQKFRWRLPVEALIED